MEEITLQVFFTGLLISSSLTSLVTEAVKKMFAEHKISCLPNTLTAIVAVILSIGIGVGYMLVKDIAFSASTIIYLVALVFMSWLCAMVGYDKVSQTINQLKNGKGDK